MAEVLITLAIIGVVASITIPNMLKDSWREQAEVGLKKVYMTWTNAVELAEKEHGDLTNATLSGYSTGSKGVYKFDNLDEFYDYFSYKEGDHQKSFINLIKCPETSGKCKIPNNRYKNLNGKSPNSGNFSFSGYWNFYTADGVYYKVYEGDGNNQSTGDNSGINVLVLMDLNGQKGPNVIGLDTFYFVLCIRGTCNSNGGVFYRNNIAPGFYPLGYGGSSKSGYYGCSRTNTESGAGSYCAYRIMQNGWMADY